MLIICCSGGLFYGCGIDNSVESGIPTIESVAPDVTFVGDTITILGAWLGMPSDSSYVRFDSTHKVASADCAKWTASVVSLEVPAGASSGTFAVVAGGIMSNKLDIIINPLPPYKTVVAEAGSYMMGSQTGLENELPVHEVYITHNIEASAHEITVQLWNSVMTEEQLPMPDKNLPAANISWDMAVRFCNEISNIENLDTCYIFNGSEVIYDTTADGWRLPTEAEWEYLCRAGSHGDFSGSGNLDEMGWYSGNSGYNAHPVGRKQPNSFGLYDVHGNLWEWCWDYYSPDYYQISPAVNPTGPDSGERRALRGGSYGDGAALARCASRRAPDIPLQRCGFRIVRSIK